MGWRVARSLDQLLDQINTLAPDRNKASDGSIGDAAHASRSSDHNPWYGPGIVTARDYTHDPAHGADMHKLAAQLVKSRDRRIKYIIWDRRIWQGSWQPYYGSNPHTKHMHVSVVASPLCDNTANWAIGGKAGGRALPTLKRGMSGPAVKRMQDLLNKRLVPDRWERLGGWLVCDGRFGAETERYVREFGRQVGINNSGQYGGRTRGWLDPPLLKRGSSGNAVRWVQNVLNNRQRAGLKVDGEYGPATERAVRDYQNAQQIPGGGGQVGYRTWNALHRGSYRV